MNNYKSEVICTDKIHNFQLKNYEPKPIQMLKLRELEESIKGEDKDKALNMCQELYNQLRDFSQCIDIIEGPEGPNIKMNQWTTGERTKYLKVEIQKLVGGH